MGLPIIAPSVLSSDFGNLERDILWLNESPADWIHIDIMDGVFVPNISFGFPVLKSIQKVAKKPLDVHLMIVDPDKYISEFKNCGAETISVHIEACSHLHRTLQNIRNEGCKPGVAVNPHTSVDLLEPVLEELDLVCLMSVNPGFGGQSFIEATYRKVEKLRAMIDSKGLSTKIEIDGGVTNKNSQQLISAGADVLVAGSYVFGAEDRNSAIESLKL